MSSKDNPGTERGVISGANKPDTPSGNGRKSKLKNKSPGGLRFTDQHKEPLTPSPIPQEHDSMLTINGLKVPFHSKDLEILGLLGKGAYGVVHKMVHKRTSVVMAVKRVPLGLSYNKKQTSMDLNVFVESGMCPYIVKFFGAMVEEGEIWICMEHMDLAMDKLYKVTFENDFAMEEDFLRKLAFSVVKALAFLKTELKVMHRDVKPSNILVNQHGDIKICDFGVSGYLENSLAMTRIGCKFYMSPERINPADDCEGFGIKADVWSLGISLIEIATGSYPYDQWKNPFHQVKQVVDGPAPSLPTERFSDVFCSFVSQCLQKEVEKRANYEQLLEHSFLMEKDSEKIDISDFVQEIISISSNSSTKQS